MPKNKEQPEIYSNVFRSRLHDAGFIVEDIDDMLRKLKKQGADLLEGRMPTARLDFASAVRSIAKENDLDTDSARRLAAREPQRLLDAAISVAKLTP